MIKIVLIWIFYLFLLFPAFSAGNTDVNIQLLPGTRPVTMTLSSVVLLFASAGILVTVILALIDRAQLKAKNRQIQKEMASLQEELQSLRHMVTMEREAE